MTGEVGTTLNKACGRLKHLNLSQCKRVGSPEIQRIFEHNELVSLNLAFVDGVSDEAFFLFPSSFCATSSSFSSSLSSSALGGRRRSPLQSLNLCQGKITDLTMFRLAFLAALLEIRLQFCLGITDCGVAAMAALCPRLRLVDLKCCHITDLSLVALARLRHLKTLDLSWCSSLSDAGISQLTARKTEGGEGLEPVVGGERDEARAFFQASVAAVAIAAEANSVATSTGAEEIATEGRDGNEEAGEEEEFPTAAALSAETAAATSYFFGQEIMNSNSGDDEEGLCSSIECLSLVWCSQLTDRTLQSLQQLPSLRRVEVAGCSGMSAAGMDEARGQGIEIMQ